MKKALVYIHGKGGKAEEAAHYVQLFPGWEVLGFAYSAQTPWEAAAEFPDYFEKLSREYEKVQIIGNSIGAYFAMAAELDRFAEKAYFISPVVDMEKLIHDMMGWAGVTEEMLQERKEIQTPFGETLSWEYLCYVREHPIRWQIPTHILYGEKDNLTAFQTVSGFAARWGASLDVVPGGEHWFHTPEQMAALDAWIVRRKEGD